MSLDEGPPGFSGGADSKTAGTLDDASVAATTRRLRALAVHLTLDAATADDVVQDAWLAMLSKDRTEVRRPGPWLRQVVRYVARRRGRRDAQRVELERTRAVADEDPALGPEAAASTAAMAELLRRSVDELREPYREVVQLRFFDGLEVRDISRRLRRPQDTVKSQVRRGLTELRGRLDKEHDGDRERWLTALLPFLPGEGAVVPVRTTAVPAAVGVAAVVLPLVALVWFTASVFFGEAATAVATDPAVTQTDDRDDPVERTGTSPAASGPSVTQRVPVSTGRTLELFVTNADGSVPAAIEVHVWGRAKKRLGSHRQASRELTLRIPEADLGAAPRIPGEHGGVAVSVREADTGAWSAMHLIELPPQGRRVEITAPGRGQTLRGVVRDDRGTPLADAFVGVSTHRSGPGDRKDGIPMGERPFETRTDAEGRFAIDGLIVRAHRVFVQAAGYLPSRAIVEGEQAKLDRDFTLRRGGIVRGALRLPDGAAAKGARVWDATFMRAGEDAGNRPVTADELGRYELSGVEPGPRWIFALLPGKPLHFAAAIVDVAAATPRTWDADLGRSVGIRCRIETAAGEPAAGIPVALLATTGPPWAYRWRCWRPPVRRGRIGCAATSRAACTSRSCRRCR